MLHKQRQRNYAIKPDGTGFENSRTDDDDDENPLESDDDENPLAAALA